MDSPKVVNCRNEPYDVYIGRPSKWGNPFTHIKDGRTKAKYICDSRDEAIQKFEHWITKGEGRYLLTHISELRGKTLGCWCSPKACHGDVLLKLANSNDFHVL